MTTPANATEEQGDRSRWFADHAWVVLGGLSVVAAATAGLVLIAHGPDALDLQFASSADAFTDVLSKVTGGQSVAIGQVRSALHRDTFFIVAYTAALVAWVTSTGRLRMLGRRAPTTLASAGAVAAGVLDLLENHATRRALDAVADGRTPHASAITNFAMGKWCCVVAVLAYLLVRALGTPRRRASKHVPCKRYHLKGGADPEPQKPNADVAHRAATPGLLAQLAPSLAVRFTERLRSGDGVRKPGRWQRVYRRLFVDPAPDRREPNLEPEIDTGSIGVACSGGGIRSASFSLGALQVLREQGVLSRASHVTAVSGGGYMAAGWAIAASRHPSQADNVFAPDSQEERWLRRHTNLLPDVRTALQGLGRGLGGLVLNLVLIWLVIIAISRPIGWFVHVTHSELRGREPYIAVSHQPTVLRAIGEPAAVPAVRVVEATGETCVCDAPLRLWSVTPFFEKGKVLSWTDSIDRGEQSDPDDLRLDLVRPGLVSVVDRKLVVIRQPLVGVPESLVNKLAPRPSEWVDTRARPLIVDRQPQLSVVDDSMPAGAPAMSQFRVSAPDVRQYSGTTGRKAFKIDNWMWLLVAVAAAAFVVVQFARAFWRPTKPRGTFGFRIVTGITWAALAVVVGALIVLPWLVHTMPTALARIISALPGPDLNAAENAKATAAVATGGTGVLMLATVGRTLRGRVTGLARKWPLQVAKVAVAAVLVAVPFVLLINSVEVAAANGPGGHLTGVSTTMTAGPAQWLRWTSDITRWFAVLLALVLWRQLVDAHAFSLFPFYKRRMSESFAVERTRRGVAQPVPYETELAWANTNAPLPARGYSGFHLNGDGPELVLCATANAYGAGEVASGRRASPFTFSRSTIGGPDIGYMRTADYLNTLGFGRRKDVTMPASIAIAGAAFGPGMGKASKGPIDNLLAVTNARLGVWLPHPAYVAERRRDDREHRWRDRPGWPYFIRELTGWFRLQTPYLYVTDGGHWENIGLVELLRRGCRNVVVISAAGDGAESFSTIAEAFALAREELGLEIAVDLEPLRAPDVVSGAEVKPPNLRRGEGHHATPVAPAPFMRGVIRKMGDNNYGTIVVLEANLTAHLPADVAAWAEGHAIFPDDPTVDQNFSHRQFESYRRLGRFQMLAALRDAAVRTDLKLGKQAPDEPSAPEAPANGARARQAPRRRASSPGA